MGYNITRIKKELGIITFDPKNLINSIYSEFHVGDKILTNTIKEKIVEIYSNNNFKKVPKATDLKGYFKVKESSMRVNIDGKSKTAKCYELLESYEDQIREEYKIAK